MENQAGSLEINGVKLTQTSKKITNKNMENSKSEVLMETEAPMPTSITIDTAKVESLTKELEKVKAENAAKEYVVKMTPNLLEFYENFMKHQASWKGMEALGIAKIQEKISQSKREGLKDSVIFMNNLHIEATHYFLNKYEGKGSALVPEYIDLMTNMDAAIRLVSADNQKTREIEKELKAAQQGLEFC